MWLRKRHISVRVSALVATLLLGTAAAAQAQGAQPQPASAVGRSARSITPPACARRRPARRPWPPPSSRPPECPCPRSRPSTCALPRSPAMPPAPPRSSCCAPATGSCTRTSGHTPPSPRCSRATAAGRVGAAPHPRARCPPRPRPRPGPAPPPTSSRPTTSPTCRRPAGPGTRSRSSTSATTRAPRRDLATYRSTYGLPRLHDRQRLLHQGQPERRRVAAAQRPTPDWETEISLDLDAVSALCPNCHILLVEANSSLAHRPRRRRSRRPQPRRQPGLQQLGGHGQRARSAELHVHRRRGHRRHRRPRLSRRRPGRLSGRVSRRHRRRRHDARRRGRRQPARAATPSRRGR